MIDLFAGCGGLTQGFVNAGFEPVLAVEWDHAGASTYAANFGDAHVHNIDIADLHRRDIPTADVVIGGPPCQGFSNLGTRNPADPRNLLWREYVRVVRTARPSIFVIENVDRFARSDQFALLINEIESGDLKQWSNYSWAVLNAADYGTPQRRKRTIFIASRIGPVTLPPPTHSKLASPTSLPWNTVRDAIGTLDPRTQTTELPHSTEMFFGKTIPGIFKTTDLHIGRNPTPRSRQRYDHIPPGGGRFNLPNELLPPCWANKKTGTTDVMGRMRWDAPSLTIRTEFFKPEKGQYLHPQWDQKRKTERVNRPITHQEAARLQTFPDTYLWCGTKLSIARQIGNAVPVALATQVAKHLRTYF